MNLLILLETMEKLKKIRKYLFFRKRGGLILPLILIIFLISSCGIAIYYYLNPPINFTNLSFYHAYNNDPNYAIGYEYFYRIYDDNLISVSTIISEANVFFTDTNLLEVLYSNRNLIDNSDFKRILPIDDDLSTPYSLLSSPVPTVSPPVFEIDPVYFDKDIPGYNFTNNIAIIDGIGYITTTNYSPAGSYKTTLDFKRYVTVNNIDFEIKSFLEIDQTQDDIPTLSTIDIDIAFFVVLYGRNENYVPIFSDVVYIGSQTGIVFN